MGSGRTEGRWSEVTVENKHMLIRFVSVQCKEQVLLHRIKSHLFVEQSLFLILIFIFCFWMFLTEWNVTVLCVTSAIPFIVSVFHLVSIKAPAGTPAAHHLQYIKARLVKPPLATSSVRKHCWANISLASCAYLLFSIFLLFLLPASSSLLLGLPVYPLASITHLPTSLFATIPSASPPAPLTALPTTRSSLLSSKI